MKRIAIATAMALAIGIALGLAIDLEDFYQSSWAVKGANLDGADGGILDRIGIANMRQDAVSPNCRAEGTADMRGETDFRLAFDKYGKFRARLFDDFGFPLRLEYVEIRAIPDGEAFIFGASNRVNGVIEGYGDASKALLAAALTAEVLAIRVGFDNRVSWFLQRDQGILPLDRGFNKVLVRCRIDLAV